MTEEKYRLIKLILLAIFVVGFLTIAFRFTNSISGSWSKFAESSAKMAENGRYVPSINTTGWSNGVPLNMDLIDTRDGTVASPKAK